MLSCSHQEQGRYPIPPPAAARAFAGSITRCRFFFMLHLPFPCRVSFRWTVQVNRGRERGGEQPPVSPVL